jgi:glutathione S-transferase
MELFGYAELGELADVSPFVTKLESYLRLAELPYAKRPGDPRTAPRNKLPYIVHAGRSITDSQGVIEYLREQSIADLDAWLDADQRAELCMLRSMLELDFYFVIVYFRWQNDAGWAGYRAVIGDVMRKSGAPAFLLPLILRHVRNSAVAQCVAQGAGKRELEENLAHAREIFMTLDCFVARHEGPWWFGAKPSSADAIVHAFVGHAIVPRMGLPVETLADDHPGLRAWFEHVHARVRRPGLQ